MEFAAEQASRGENAQVWGPSGYVGNWGRTTFENWQSEMLQLFTMVVLTSFLVHRGSVESKDSDEEMQHALERIEDRLNNMDAGPTGMDRTPWEPTVRAGRARLAVRKRVFVRDGSSISATHKVVVTVTSGRPDVDTLR